MRLFAVIIIAAGMAVGSPRELGKSESSSNRIIVHVYNSARVPISDLRFAQETATRIFQHAGVQLTWPDSAPATAQLEPNEVIVRIVPEPAPNFEPRSLGMAYVGGGVAVNATVYYLRVKKCAQRAQLSASQVLGPAIAHEIVHLLQADARHSPSGLMHAAWKKNELRLAGVGLLGLTRDDEQRMRAGISRRPTAPSVKIGTLK